MKEIPVAEIHFTYLNGLDIAALELDDQEILDAVEAGLRAQGLGQTVIEPRVHLEPDPAFRGHFNVLRGYIAPLGYAGVKIVGDYIDNYKAGSLEKWGIGYEDVLSKRFPELIYCSVTGFGADGPFGGFPGYDAVAQALTGQISVNGSPEC